MWKRELLLQLIRTSSPLWSPPPPPPILSTLASFRPEPEGRRKIQFVFLSVIENWDARFISVSKTHYLKFQIVSLGVMTKPILKFQKLSLKHVSRTKKFKPLARYFRRCFENPKSNNTGLAPAGRPEKRD